MAWTTPSSQVIDKDLVKKATEILKLNLSKDLFTKTDKKSTIQYLFSTYYSKSLDFYNECVSSISESTLNGLIRKIRNESGSRLKDIYGYTVEGEYGPGEVLFYLLTKDSTLGGKNSRGADLLLPGGSYEIKAVKKYAASGLYYDFKLGDTDFSALIGKLRKIKGVAQSGDIQKSVIDKLRSGDAPFDKDSQKVFLQIEKEFEKLAQAYFKSAAMFISSSDTNLAEIYSIKSTAEMQRVKFFIERFTSNTLKPMVQL